MLQFWVFFHVDLLVLFHVFPESGPIGLFVQLDVSLLLFSSSRVYLQLMMNIVMVFLSKGRQTFSAVDQGRLIQKKEVKCVVVSGRVSSPNKAMYNFKEWVIDSCIRAVLFYLFSVPIYF